MVQELTTIPNMFGRIGKGLGESIPKEFERNRLATGLKQLGEQKGLTPFQQYAGLVGAAHEYPQVVQSGAELLRQQGIRNAYSNMGKGNQRGQQGQGAPSIDSIQFGQQQGQTQKGMPPISGSETPQGNFPPGEPQIVEKNPLSPELQPRVRFTPEQFYDTVARIGSQNPNLTNNEIMDLARQEEQRYLEAPEDYKKQQENLEKEEAKANLEIEKQIRKKLQIPEKEEIFAGNKITGETLNRIERGVAKDLRSNPNATLKDLVNTWTDRALNNDKAKIQLKELAGRDWQEKIFKRSENLEKLKSLAKSFKEFGNSEEYANILKSDFRTSPEGGASIAYPLSKTANEYVGKIKESNASNFNKNAIKYANDLGEYLTKGDSILSIAKNIKERDPFFDIKSFLSEVRNIQDDLGLTGAQKLELNARGIGEIFPNWGDVFLFPRTGKGL